MVRCKLQDVREPVDGFAEPALIQGPRGRPLRGIIAVAADVFGAQWALAGVGAIMILYSVTIWAKKSIRNLD